MSTAEVSFACAWALVDELVRGGVRHACLSPGSQSTPLALALDRHPGLTVHVHLDERSSAFVALGLSKALDEPVALACTSGTATAEFFPAVVEASQSRVPLIVLTADRPPRLRGTGANQTIDQIELYGGYVRSYAATLPDASPEDWSSIGRGTVRDALAYPGGPVQINVPFDEPLVPRILEQLEASTWEPPDWPLPPVAPEQTLREGEQHTAYWAGADELFAPEHDVERGVVVIGSMLDRPHPHTQHQWAPYAAQLAVHLGWPCLSEPWSNGRHPHQGTFALSPMTAGISLMSSPSWMDRHSPKVVLQFGAPPTSRPVLDLVAAADHLIVVGTELPEADPEERACTRVRFPTDHFLSQVSDFINRPDFARARTWLDAWHEADAAARAAIDSLLESWDEPSEMRVARDLAAAVPDGGTLFVGNSMPVRDLDAFMAPRDGLRVLANRGASGIDGLLSTALGVAAAGTGPTFALLGDLSFLHDAGALLWNARRGTDLVVVVNDNGGGQIFAGLGQRELPGDELERLFVTPHGLDLERLCAAAGAGHGRVELAADLVPALDAASAAGGVQIVQVVIDAERDRARRVELHTAVEAALEGLVPR